MADPVAVVTLSRALKLKNRVVHRLSQLDAKIVAYNSTIDTNQEYDVRELYLARLVLAQGLVALKTAISAANAAIQQTIFELAECKSLIATLGRVDTKHGVVVEGYSGAKTTYVAQLRKADIDKETRRVEREADRLQDVLDQYNHTHTLSVPAALLAEEQIDPPGR